MENFKKLSMHKIIYFLYVFFLPFQLCGFIKLPSVLTTYVFYNSSTVFLWIGLALIIVNGRPIKISKGIKSLFYLYMFMSIYSILAATVTFLPFGTLNGESTFRAVIGDIVFYFMAILSVYYNYYSLTYTIKFDELRTILLIQTIILLFIGYIQYAIIKGIGGITGIYNSLAIILNFLPSSRLGRGVVFGGTEPSAASEVCMLSIPYLYATIIERKNKSIRHKITYMILALLFIPLLLTSNSSTFFIVYFISLVGFIILYIGKPKMYTIFLCVAFASGAVISIMYGLDSVTNYVSSSDKSSLLYIVFGKIFDTSSLSTAMRSSTIINDMKIFLSYPITGVGDGLQGYFYNANVPSWAKASREVMSWISGERGVINGGGAFFSAYISAYGMIGIFVLVRFVKEYVHIFRNHASKMGISKYIFLIFAVVFVSASWYSLGIKQNQYVAFMLCLPLVQYVDFNNTYMKRK